MKKSIPYLIIAALVVVIFLQNSCEPNPSKAQSIVIPEKEGKSPITKPEQVVITPKKPVVIPKGNKSQEEINFLQNQIDSLLKQNADMEEAFANETDSLKQELYNKAIALRLYENKFSDDDVEINATGVVRGEIQSMIFEYKIKAKTIEAPAEKEVTFRLMGGVEFGNTLEFDSFLVKGNLGFQNKKGNIFTASFDTEQRIWVGYNASIFRIKN
jgi:hypothetical protein